LPKKELKIKIDYQLIKPKAWVKDTLHIYALSAYTIGISPEVVKEWNEYCLLHLEIPYEHTTKSIDFIMPEQLYHFYNFIQPETKHSLSGHREIVLMTITREWENDIEILIDKIDDDTFIGSVHYKGNPIGTDKDTITVIHASDYIKAVEDALDILKKWLGLNKEKNS